MGLESYMSGDAVLVYIVAEKQEVAARLGRPRKLQTATRRLYDLLLTPDVEIVRPQDVDMDTFAVLADYFFEAAQRRHRSAQVSHVPYSKGLEIGSGRVTKIRAKHHADTGSNIVAGRQESGANRQPLLFMPTDLPTDITKAAMKLSNHQADHRIKRWLLDSWNALFPAREKQRTQIHPSDIARVVVHGWPEDFPPFGKPLSKVATGDLRILVAITDAGYFTMEMVLETDDDEMTLSAESGEEGSDDEE